MPKIITLTGHRDVDETITATLVRQQIKNLIDVWGGPEYLRARWGGAAGADTIFAEQCIAYGVPLDLYLPDPFYEKRSIKQPWRPRFKYCKDHSEHHYFSAETNDWKNNFKRNIQMIHGCNYVFAAYYHDDIAKFTPHFRPRKGGTAHGIQTALAAGHVLGATLIHLPVIKAQPVPDPPPPFQAF